MMALAAPVPKEDKVSMFRDKAYKVADQWVESLAAALTDDKPMTLEDISALFEEKKAELMGALVKDFIAVRHSEDLGQHTAPDSVTAGDRVVAAPESVTGGDRFVVAVA
jgi:hypothetical protein